MIGVNIQRLRKLRQMTQEQLAEAVGVTRQAVAKWESGETQPDIQSCAKLADTFSVTVDNLICYSEEETGLMIPEKGKFFFGSVSVGDRGQIVIPKKAREVFRIQPGDQLLVLGDIDRGIAIVHQRDLMGFMGMAGAAVLGENQPEKRPAKEKTDSKEEKE